MTEQMKNYKEYLDTGYNPIDVNSLPYFLDMKAIHDYAKAKNVKITELSQEEKSSFLIQNTASSNGRFL